MANATLSEEMAKTRDFPPALRHFVKVLNSFRGYYYDYDIFRDFIDYTTACFLWEGDKELADQLKGRYKEDYPRFNEMFTALVNTMADNMSEDLAWYDALGTLYEEIASYSKASFLGQFFTPPTVCDFMAQIQQPLSECDEKRTGLTVNDPASGSGRMLLAFNKVAPGNYLVGQDVDVICTKMTAINLALHGCKGQALNGDSLWPDHFVFGYEINPRIFTLGGLPHIVPIRKEQSVAWQVWHSNDGEPIKAHPEKQTEPVKQTIILPEYKPGQQLSIFEVFEPVSSY
ncbi:MAG: N-6 DNA methylase [Bacteroidales bacterium]|nr:N-6 DNA methylase [Bacteroidales bacterium]